MLENKIVWVTGAGRGIGKAIAGAFAGERTTLALSARTAREIEAVADSIRDKGGRAVAFPCDVSSEDDINQSVENIRQTLGGIDILVNNAGVGKFATIHETTVADWNWMMDINLKGVFLCTRAVLPSMIERRQGHIINISSVAGIQPFPYSAAYCASKYGLMGLTAVTREEVREHRIKVTAIVPGATETPFWDAIGGDFDRSKMMPAEDIAHAVVAACQQSDDSLIEDIILRPIGGNL